MRDDTYPALGEAWRIAGDGHTLIWGDTAINPEGSILHMNFFDAMEYCIGLNPEEEREAIRAALNSGHPPAAGIYLPLRSDFVRLGKQLGSAVKYKAQILPNLGHWFRSSSVHHDYSSTRCVFVGYTGYVDYDDRAYADDHAVRCVARR